MVFGKIQEKIGQKMADFDPDFLAFHRCETGKRGYGVKFQVSQIKKWLAFFNRVSKIETAICEETERGIRCLRFI